MTRRRRAYRDAIVAGAVFESILETLFDLGWLSIPENIDDDLFAEVMGRAAAGAVDALDA